MNGKTHADDQSRGLFRADWDSVLMIHLEVEPDDLQHHTPYPLDTYEGRAFVTLVAFTMRRMRFIKGGRCTQWMTAVIADHAFLNVRTYLAFNSLRKRRLKFQVWHAPSPMQPVHTKLTKRDLITKRWPLLSQAPVVKAHYCHGLKDVIMGKPTRV